MIFLVKQIDFDDFENRHAAAVSTKLLGYTETREAADHYIANLLKRATTYEGWDGETYPQFAVTTGKPLAVARSRKSSAKRSAKRSVKR